MDPMSHEQSHRAAVDAWIKQVIDDADPAEVVDLFRVAIETLWGRAVTTLGSVTLIAIAERVLSTATGRYSFLSAVNPRPNGDMRWKQQLRDRLAQVPRPELIEGLRFAFIELLTVIGRLTAEILSPDLHAALLEVTAKSLDAEMPAGLHALPSIIARKVQSSS
jgi:hypothetical protein